jgi:hypothetical protein
LNVAVTAAAFVAFIVQVIFSALTRLPIPPAAEHVPFQTTVDPFDASAFSTTVVP